MTQVAADWERWVRAPRQDRARATFERVLDTGAVLLAEQGYEGFSMAEVCRRAEVAAGTLYGRVEGKAELFLALHDRELDRITADALESVATLSARRRLSTRRLVDEVVDLLADHYARNHALLRVFVLRAAVDQRVRDEGARYVARVEESVVSLLMTRGADYPHRDTELAVRTVCHIVMDSMSWRTAFGVDFHAPGVHDDPTDPTWRGRLRDVARTYLLTPAS